MYYFFLTDSYTLSLISWTLTSQRLFPWQIYVYRSSHCFNEDYPCTLKKNGTKDSYCIVFKPAIAICARSEKVLTKYYWQCWFLDPSLNAPAPGVNMPMSRSRTGDLCMSEGQSQDQILAVCLLPKDQYSWGPWLCFAAFYKETMQVPIYDKPDSCAPFILEFMLSCFHSPKLLQTSRILFLVGYIFTMKFLYILLAVLPLAPAIANYQKTACRCAPKPCPVTQPEVHVLAFWYIAFVNHRINSYPKWLTRFHRLALWMRER